MWADFQARIIFCRLDTKDHASASHGLFLVERNEAELGCVFRRVPQRASVAEFYRGF